MSRPRVGPSFSKGIAERPKYASVRELNSHPRERPCKTLKKEGHAFRNIGKRNIYFRL